VRARTASIVTVGTELVQGLRVDTNTAEIASALAARDIRVIEAVSVADDAAVLADELARLVARRDLVITTGGLGPTHDDITREAASRALGTQLAEDARLVRLLEPIQRRHSDPQARARVLSQAQVLPGAEVIDFTTGTAPGLVVAVPGAATLALLPGPPSEMRPMLADLLGRYPFAGEEPRHLGVVGMTESDAQAAVERAIQQIEGVGFTILARPGDVRIVLTDLGAGAAGLERAAGLARDALGERCYATDQSTLAQVVVREAALRGATIALAESCTGGMVAAALTDVPGSSNVFLGGIVAYSDRVKKSLLGVPEGVLERHGAVSAQCVEAMAAGAYEAFDGPDVVVSVSGIAGPEGGSEAKPVGTVWFGVHCDTARGVSGTAERTHRGARFRRDLGSKSRELVRARATSVALDCLRRAVLGLPIPE